MVVLDWFVWCLIIVFCFLCLATILRAALAIRHKLTIRDHAMPPFGGGSVIEPKSKSEKATVAESRSIPSAKLDPKRVAVLTKAAVPPGKSHERLPVDRHSDDSDSENVTQATNRSGRIWISEVPPDWLAQAPDPEEPDFDDGSSESEEGHLSESRQAISEPATVESFWTPRHHIAELHYITPIPNVESILRYGILSHNGAQQYGPESVAMPEVNVIRSAKRLPSGRTIHDYANLYFNARNPMMFKRKEHHAQLCILRISADVLDLKNIYIADGNAASRSTRFLLVPSSDLPIDEVLVFGDSWYDPDPETLNENRRRRCAELLVPGVVEQRYITGAYVSNLDGRMRLEQWMSRDMIRISERMFFHRSW